MNKKGVIKIGLDLDGVLAQHSLGGFWFKLRKLKEKLLKKTHSSSYYFPKTIIEKIAWVAIDWFRHPQEKEQFFLFTQNKRLKFYLITGRFNFLEDITLKWLRKNKLITCFEKVLVNTQDLDPTEFKAKKINQLSLDFYIDDDLETISDLTKKTPINFFWLNSLNFERLNAPHPRIIIVRSLIEALRQIEANS